jgi:BirA family transcriptional regulator, biotin operon repressor / biotin---[acetyl-CoA-carboxylase] ligase
MIMDERTLRRALSTIPLGGLRYFEQTGSTNDAALAWAVAGAPDLALVYTEEQTAGRGRGSRRWFTPPRTALAFSLVFRPLSGEEQSIPLFSALGALAVCEVLEAQGLHPEIKWPNDVLLNQRKVCGILAESIWMGEKVDSIVLGVGLNIKPQAVPPPAHLTFPATCLEAELPSPRHGMKTVEQAALLQHILHATLHWRDLLGSDLFLHAWENRLAFRGEQVEIWVDGQALRTGQVDSLGQDGSLRLLSPQGQVFAVQFGEVHLRPVA